MVKAQSKYRPSDSELIKEFGLTRTGYYWVKFKGEKDEGDSDDKEYRLAHFDLAGSMTQTARTFRYTDRDIHLRNVLKVHSYVERPVD